MYNVHSFVLNIELIQVISEDQRGSSRKIYDLFNQLQQPVHT